MMDADTMVLPRLGDATVEDPWGEDRPRRAAATAATAALTRWRIAAWLVPAVLTGALGAARITTSGLSTGEAATRRAATSPWPGIGAALTGDDLALGPYHLLVRGWAALFGAADLALRVPSLLAMVGAAALVGALAARIATPAAGLLAGVLFAVLPTSARYAQEAQPYALAVFAAVLATWLLVPALDRPRLRRLVPYAGAVLLLGLCQPVALLLLAGHGWAVLAFRRRGALRWLAAVGLGLLPVAALLATGLSGGGRLASGVRPGAAVLAATPGDLFGVAALAGVLAGLALFSLPLRHPAAICTAWALVPALGLLALAQAVPVWSAGNLLFTVPAWAVLGGVALSRARAAGALAVLALVALLAVAARLPA
ncbi:MULTISPECIES: glycosyltransferase family 39 protein [unclassified Micromonospora]|uniref:glycosyltransferase family 39 protein n=1 Tax=unclassified Micromonospora TaxID=2617518 RepID=UPI001C20F861|nr:MULTISPECIES: glycosyltransferase family 39 protein [unclassified Micromonospora]MBU8861354.1 glycosyltransferase family 39 protein [Micromonospora sp. WMMB482]MDM4780910.1 glycosyltransferase family 39 protein [Micromonospora sp. b486]